MRQVGSLFFVIGLGLLLAAFFSYRSTSSFVDAALRMPGTVVELTRSASSGSTSTASGSTYRPVVSFRDANGNKHEFISSVGSNPPSHRKGEAVEVLYLENEPHEAKINSFMHLWFFAVLLGGLGLVFLLLGLGLLIPRWIRGKAHDRLRRTGTPIRAKLQQVTELKGRRSGDRHPYQIVAQWLNPRTGEIHVFKSEPIWFEPTQYLESDEVTVFIELNNPRKYYVDVTMLPKLAD